MKKGYKMKKLIIPLVLLTISCGAKNKENTTLKNKEDMKKVKIQNQNKKETSSLEDFFKKYYYLDYVFSNDRYNCINVSSNNILKKYIKNKEKNLIKLRDSSQIFENLPKEERIKKIIEIMLELLKKEEEHNLDWVINKLEIMEYLVAEISEYNNGLPNSNIDAGRKSFYKKSFFEFLEKNYSKEEIEKILETITIEVEHGNYYIDGRYGLKKIDEVIEKLEKIEPITSEEWIENENRGAEKFFDSQIEDSFCSPAYILKNNKIMIVDEYSNKKVIKEIKITDYKNVSLILYKNIIYIYDAGKIFEYSGKNFENVKVVESRNVF